MRGKSAFSHVMSLSVTTKDEAPTIFLTIDFFGNVRLNAFLVYANSTHARPSMFNNSHNKYNKKKTFKIQFTQLTYL